MKYLITEKANSMVIFIDAYVMTEMCNIADLIEDHFPQSVVEVTHNRNTKQGSIILKKDIDIQKIEKLFER